MIIFSDLEQEFLIQFTKFLPLRFCVCSGAVMAIRTVCVAVSEILEGGTKTDFYVALRKTLNDCTKVANIALNHAVKQDDFSQTKKPKIYTYPMVSPLNPGASSITATICREAEKLYGKERFQMIVGRRSLRTYRSFPVPLLHNKSTDILQLEDRGEFVSARMKVGPSWFTVRLSGGSNYRRQTARLRQAIAASTYRDSKIWLDKRGVAILGVACDISAEQPKDLKGVMRVVTSRESLLIITREGWDRPFAINADKVQRWEAEKNIRYHRLRQDRKSGVDRRKIAAVMNAIGDKHRNRLSSLIHEVSLAVVTKAKRLGVAEIELDTTVRSYVRSFPWQQLEQCIKYKAEDAGIKLSVKTLESDNPDLASPHVYFKLSPSTGRIKIGHTKRSDGGRHGAETDSPEELIILALENCPKAKIVAREKHFHAMFQQHRVRGEWFTADPVLNWLREAGWLGNAGNRSQISQVLDVSVDTFRDGDLNANRDCPQVTNPDGCSQKAEKKQGYSDENRAALAVKGTSSKH
jgi:hypothetical protein